MRYHEIVPESISTPAEYSWQNQDEATFAIGENTYKVVFKQDRFGPMPVIEIIFVLNTNDPLGSSRPSGTGNAFAVYSTVLAIVHDFVEQNAPKRLTIVSQTDAKSRHKVNTRMADLIAAQNGYSVEEVGRMLLLTRRRRR